MFEFLRHLFLPHHTNNFRAKILHLDFFALYVVAFFVLSLSFQTIHRLDPNILGFATDIHTEQLLNFTNQKRAEAGLAPLTLNAQLSQAASNKAADMFSKNYWAHVAPDGTTPWDFINKSGYIYSIAGENLAKNFSDSNGVVEAWMNSPSHRDNLLRSDYQDIGFAVVNGTLNGEETTLVVQMFGKGLTRTIAQNPVTTTTIIPSLAKEAQAETGSTPVARFTSELEATPAEKTPIAHIVPSPSPNVVITAGASVTKTPLFDMGVLTKRLTLGLSSVLMAALVIDGIYIWRRKVVRIGGRNIAHILFLFLINGVIWAMSFGSVI